MSKETTYAFLENLFVTRDPSERLKDTRYRQRLFVDWLFENNIAWHHPDLDRHANFLVNEKGLAESSAVAHIATIRSNYRKLLERDDLIDLIRTTIADDAPDREEQIVASIQAIYEATLPKSGHVEANRKTDFFYPTTAQLNELFKGPDLETSQGKRDIAILGLIFCGGLSENEISKLRREDVHFAPNDGNEVTITVPKTPGGKARTIPLYDQKLFDMSWLKFALRRVNTVCDHPEDSLFSGFHRGGYSTNNKPLSPRAIRKIVHKYPITVVEDQSTKKREVTTLELRRSFARRLFLHKVPTKALQAHLGHGRRTTTLEYISPTAEEPKPEEYEPCAAGPILNMIQTLDEKLDEWRKDFVIDEDDE